MSLAASAFSLGGSSSNAAMEGFSATAESFALRFVAGEGDQLGHDCHGIFIPKCRHTGYYLPMFEIPRKLWTKPPQNQAPCYLRPERVQEKQWAAFVEGFANIARDHLVDILNCHYHGGIENPNDLRVDWVVDGNPAELYAAKPSPGKIRWDNARTLELCFTPSGAADHSLAEPLKKLAAHAQYHAPVQPLPLKVKVMNNGGIQFQAYRPLPLMQAFNRAVLEPHGVSSIDISALAAASQQREKNLLSVSGSSRAK